MCCTGRCLRSSFQDIKLEQSRNCQKLWCMITISTIVGNLCVGCVCRGRRFHKGPLSSARSEARVCWGLWWGSVCKPLLEHRPSMAWRCWKGCPRPLPQAPWPTCCCDLPSREPSGPAFAKLWASSCTWTSCRGLLSPDRHGGTSWASRACVSRAFLCGHFLTYGHLGRLS